MKPNSEIIPHVVLLEYFLPLFPVFTLSTNFPIIAISLCNNLKSIFLTQNNHLVINSANVSRRHAVQERFLFPLIATIPPILIAFIVEDLETLVGFVGSYAGASIQYIIPAALVYYGRKRINEVIDSEEILMMGQNMKMRFKSPFRHVYWIFFVLTWAIVSIIFVTVNNIIHFFELL